MALPRPDYRDPAEVAERREAFEIGCPACACHRVNAKRDGYECAIGKPGWPDETSRTCAWWVKRRRGPAR